MDVAVDHIDGFERLQQRLHLFGVVGPEIPALVYFLQRRMREDDDWRLVGDFRQVFLEPNALLFADHERRAVGIVQIGHLQHALLGGRPAMEGPLVGRQDRVQNDEMHALVVEAVIMGAVELAPIFAKVEVIVVLAHDAMQLGREMGENLRAVVEFVLLAELREVAAEHDEIQFRLHEISFRHRALKAHVPVAHEARALDLLDVRVGNIGEGEVVARAAEGEAHHADGKRRQRPDGARRARRHHASSRDQFAHGFDPPARAFVSRRIFLFFEPASRMRRRLMAPRRLPSSWR